MQDPKEILCVFDMDHTLCDAYSEQSFLQQVPKEDFDSHIHKYRGSQFLWTHLMHSLITKYPPKIENVEKYMRGCKMVNHMKELLLRMSNQGYKMVLVSGSNRVCVNYFLEHNGLEECFDQLFCLNMQYCTVKEAFTYQHQEIVCERPICTHGYCKGIVVKNYLETNPYKRVYYFGDGPNDLCGINEIDNGVAFVREGFGLHKDLTNDFQEFGRYVKCELVYWNDGSDIVKYLDDLKPK